MTLSWCNCTNALFPRHKELTYRKLTNGNRSHITHQSTMYSPFTSVSKSQRTTYITVPDRISVNLSSGTDCCHHVYLKIKWVKCAASWQTTVPYKLWSKASHRHNRSTDEAKRSFLQALWSFTQGRIGQSRCKSLRGIIIILYQIYPLRATWRSLPTARYTNFHLHICLWGYNGPRSHLTTIHTGINRKEKDSEATMSIFD